jgi:zinc protease
VVVAFRLPPTASPDTPVFDVISYILSTGNSSRLYRALVRDQQIATQVDGSPQDLLMGGIFYFDALANAGKKPEEVERALTTQIDLLRSQPVSAAELEKAKSQALTAKVFGSISTEQKASALGEADLLYGTPEAVNREQAKIAAVTAADVQRVARKYFAPEVRNVLTIVPAPPPSDGGTPSNAPTAGGAR